MRAYFREEYRELCRVRVVSLMEESIVSYVP